MYRAAFLNTTVRVVDSCDLSIFETWPLIPNVCGCLPRFVILNTIFPRLTELGETRNSCSDGFPAVTKTTEDCFPVAAFGSAALRFVVAKSEKVNTAVATATPEPGRNNASLPGVGL